MSSRRRLRTKPTGLGHIREKSYRLITKIKYGPLFLVYILFVGTHAEYDRIDAATI